jgi:hypothetical protein
MDVVRECQEVRRQVAPTTTLFFSLFGVLMPKGE